MVALPDFPVLDSPAKCAGLWSQFPENVVGMWATGLPRQNVDVLWRLRKELLKLDVPVVFFFKESAKSMLATVITAEASPAPSIPHIYQLDNASFFRLLNFVDVLVSNDTFLQYDLSRYIGAKLVGLPHNAKLANPYFWNYCYDYFVSDQNELADFDYSFYPDHCKIHRKSNFTQLVAGHPKIDLLLEERQKNVSSSLPVVLLLYPVGVDFSIKLQNISAEKYVEIWSDVVSAFLEKCPDGVVVFRPVGADRSHPLVELLRVRFAEGGRFFIDEDDDNKFWLARARYFVTDYSEAFINFCMTAKRPAIRMVYTVEEWEPWPDEWGWTIRRPAQLAPLLEQMDMQEKQWTEALNGVQNREMPTLGQNFVLLASMIKRIFQDDDDPAWLTMDKGCTPCRTAGDLLKLVAKWSKKSSYQLKLFHSWFGDVEKGTSLKVTPTMMLLFLRRALLPHYELDYTKCNFAGYDGTDAPDDIAQGLDKGLSIAVDSLPLTQTVGLLRHCLRKNSQLAATALLLTIISVHVPGGHKKRALFFLLVEWPQYDGPAMESINEMVQRMPHHFSRPVLARLNRFLPLVMKIPLPLRRFGARILGLKKPLAKKYWDAHKALS